jgi:hypothetical protein
MVKNKYGKRFLVKNGKEEPFPRHSKRNIAFSTRSFMLIILKFTVIIRKNVVLFNGKRNIRKNVLGKKWYWGTVSLALQK